MKIVEEHEHTPEAIQERLGQNPPVYFLREWVYGGIDGVVTTFAIVSGVAGAGLSPVIILILGLANLIGDGFSMAAGAYSSTKTENDNYKRLWEIEKSHIKKYPEGEKEEIRQIFAAKGFSGKDLEAVIDTITNRRDVWIDTMMAEEYGLSGPSSPAFKAAGHTFLAFVLCGTMPLLPFFFNVPHAFGVAFVLSALTFFSIGALKSRWSIKSWWWHGLETMLIGSAAAGLAFMIGYGLRLAGLEI